MSAKRELIHRYRSTWRHAWKNRAAMEPPKRHSHEIQFLPAALALQEHPVHPAPRYILWTIMAFAALALAWACIGEIDVVATASGKVVPSGKSKIIQPSEVAVVKQIHVHDGMSVKAGQVLVELDPSLTNADIRRSKIELLAAQMDSARAATLLTAIETKQTPGSVMQLLPTATHDQKKSAQRWVEGQYLEIRSSLSQADAEIAQRTAEIYTAKSTVDRLVQTLPITRQLSADYKKLAADFYVPQHAYLEKEQARLNQERELTVQRARVLELAEAKRAAQERKASLIAQARRELLDLQHDAETRAAAFKQELNKAEQRGRLTRLTAPVDGTVQQLAIHTAGGVVTEAQPLMVIVPSDQPVEVEAMLENKDIGFVRPGQQVEVKVDTFNFTKYGVVHGTVQSISNDAIEDERLGLVYSARIQLSDSSVLVGNQHVPLSPGMSIRAEVKTGKRNIIDYFLSPLKQYADESLSER